LPPLGTFELPVHFSPTAAQGELKGEITFRELIDKKQPSDTSLGEVVVKGIGGRFEMGLSGFELSTGLVFKVDENFKAEKTFLLLNNGETEFSAVVVLSDGQAFGKASIKLEVSGPLKLRSESVPTLIMVLSILLSTFSPINVCSRQAISRNSQ
jgi:hypothetical protein